MASQRLISVPQASGLLLSVPSGSFQRTTIHLVHRPGQPALRPPPPPGAAELVSPAGHTLLPGRAVVGGGRRSVHVRHRPTPRDVGVRPTYSGCSALLCSWRRPRERRRAQPAPEPPTGSRHVAVLRRLRWEGAQSEADTVYQHSQRRTV